MDKGYWHIIYHFDGNQQYYNIKVRKNTALDGTPLINWHETHLQYRIEDDKLYVRQNGITEWNHVPAQIKRSRLVKPEFNPFWWNWPPWKLNFKQLMSNYKLIDIQQVKIENTSYYFLSLQHTDTSDTTHTLEIWLDPQKDFQPTHILAYERYIVKRLISSKKNVPKELLTREDFTVPGPPKEMVKLTRYTYELTQYKNNVWFPKTVIMEQSKQMSDDKTRKSIPIKNKIRMQVDKAVFNNPIDEKDLDFPD